MEQLFKHPNINKTNLEKLLAKKPKYEALDLLHGALVELGEAKTLEEVKTSPNKIMKVLHDRDSLWLNKNRLLELSEIVESCNELEEDDLLDDELEEYQDESLELESEDEPTLKEEKTNPLKTQRKSKVASLETINSFLSQD